MNGAYVGVVENCWKLMSMYEKSRQMTAGTGLKIKPGKNRKFKGADRLRSWGVVIRQERYITGIRVRTFSEIRIC